MTLPLTLAMPLLQDTCSSSVIEVQKIRVPRLLFLGTAFHLIPERVI
jgi:hypothetical protein